MTEVFNETFTKDLPKKALVGKVKEFFFGDMVSKIDNSSGKLEVIGEDCFYLERTGGHSTIYWVDVFQDENESVAVSYKNLYGEIGDPMLSYCTELTMTDKGNSTEVNYRIFDYIQYKNKDQDVASKIKDAAVKFMTDIQQM